MRLLRKVKGILISVGAVAVTSAPAFAAGAGDYTDVTSYAATNIPLIIAAVIGLYVAFLSLPMFKLAYRNVVALLRGR